MYRSSDVEAVVIGAGPYGLAVASHLKASGVSTHVFGEPMSFWAEHMPRGMRLRSPLRASHIADPDGAFSLDRYSAEKRIACDEQMPIGRFVDYGTWFQRQAVPDLDRRKVSRVETFGSVFRVTLADGDRFSAERVIVATGLANQQFRPAVFDGLAAQFVSHTCEHANFEAFKGMRIAIVGRGQSACESAVLLTEAGAEVELICRGDIRWLGSARWRKDWERALYECAAPMITSPSNIGRFPLNWLIEFPALVHRLPAKTRNWVDSVGTRAGAANWILPRFTNVRVRCGSPVLEAVQDGAEVAVTVGDKRIRFDHVLLATGYKIDVSKMDVFAPELGRAIACTEGSPHLTGEFESSVARLHFAGASAAENFGPLMRFVAGTSFAGRSIAQAARRRRAASGIIARGAETRLSGAQQTQRS